MLKKLTAPLIILIIFWSVAVLLWQTTGNVFYLYNFGYIGSAVGIGISLYLLLPRKHKPSARRFAQFLVGIYMLGFLGLLKKENMQLEGFFFYLLSGFFPDQSSIIWLPKLPGLFFLTGGFAVGPAGLCPITVIMKLTSRVSMLKIQGDPDSCSECGACSRMCPMDIDIMAYVKNGERVLSTECIFCLTCTTVCPEKALDSTFGVDLGGKERIKRKTSRT